MDIWQDSEAYFQAILERNKETEEDGHCPVFGVFGYDEEVLKKHREVFDHYRKNKLSPYKALTFFTPTK